MCGGGGGVLGSIAKIAVPIVLSAVAPGLGPLAMAAITAGSSAGISKLTGGSWGDALKSGAMSGLGAAAMPFLGNAFQSIAPETAASFGITGQSPTILNSLGLGGSSGGGLSAGSLNPSDYGVAPGASNMGEASLADSAGGFSGYGGTNSAAGNSTMGLSPTQMAQAAFGQPVDPNTPSDKGVLSRLSSGNNILPLLLSAGTLYSGYSSRKSQEDKQKQQDASNAANAAQQRSDWRYTLGQPALNRQPTDTSNINWSTYGYGPEQSFYNNNRLNNPASYSGPPTTGKAGGSVDGLRKKIQHLAGGGSVFPRKNGKISGHGKGMDDKVKAMLSDGEYVIPADVVAHLGDGSNDAGANMLDHVVKHVRKKKTGKTSQPDPFSADMLPEGVGA